jgi:hypothetical protein
LATNNGTVVTPVSGEAKARLQQAEVLADRLASQVATFTTAVGRRLAGLAARIREEAEDMWAEAQNVRRGDKS